MKGAKVFDQWEAPLISSDGIIVKPSQTTVYIFDGKLLVSHNGGKSYAVSSSNTSVRRQDPLSEFNGEDMLLGLDDAFKTKQFKSIKVVISEQVGQVKNAKLHITLTNELKPDLLDVWLSAAEQGYCVLRLEQRGSNGNLFYEVSDCVYALIDGVYCPKAATWKNFYHKGTVHALSESRKYTADSIVLRGNQIPDSLFDTTIPRGSTLIDRDMNNLVINDPEEVERHIREAARSVERRSFYARFHWWYFAVAALLLVAGVLLFIHVLKVRQRHL